MNQEVSFDWMILILSIILCGFGTIIIGSVSHELVGPQITFYIFGLLFFFLFSRIDHEILIAFWRLIYVVVVFSLLFTLIFGFESRGSTRWVSLGFFRLQFSELMKPFLLTSLVGFFMSRKELLIREFVYAILFVVIPVLLVFKQPDLGSALVYFFLFLVTLFSTGFPISYFFAFGLAVFSFTPLVWQFLAQYQKNRILSFFTPNIDPLGTGYNAIQSLITVGSGGFWGRGLGRGTQSQLYFLPERHTDFVFASLSEEMGFLGASVVLIIYFLLLWRIFRLAFKINNVPGKLICIGVGSIIAVQVFINVGMNMGILPLTGITLPLISYGGSSILATFALLGLVESVVREKSKGKYSLA